MEIDSVESGQASAHLTTAHAEPRLQRVRSTGLRSVNEVNRELWLLLSIFVLTALLNTLLDADHMLLGLYTLPTLFSAYVYGRRHATLTALSSVLLVVLITYFNPVLFGHSVAPLPIAEKWFEIIVWGGILLVNAYAMGTLYETQTETFPRAAQYLRWRVVILNCSFRKINTPRTILTGSLSMPPKLPRNWVCPFRVPLRTFALPL